MRINEVVPYIAYSAPSNVRDVIARLGRTEDIRFSPSGRRLAVASFWRNRIAVFDLKIEMLNGSPVVELTGVVEFSSQQLDEPHGLDFVSDEQMLVTNRSGFVCVYQIPLSTPGLVNLAPVAILHPEGTSSPGSVVVVEGKEGRKEALVCNNYVHTISRHPLSVTDADQSTHTVVLKKWLSIPDGIAASSQAKWIAVSNHGTHLIHVYEDLNQLNDKSDPVGLLKGTKYPHGLRFSSDEQYVFSADAGSPFLNIYSQMRIGWKGVRKPFISFRALSQRDYLRGRTDPQEGGLKGLDSDHKMQVLVCTCETQPLIFFDLQHILKNASRNATNSLPGNLKLLPLRFVHALWKIQEAAISGRRFAGKIKRMLLQL